MFPLSTIYTLILLYNVGLSYALFENCNFSYNNSDPNKEHYLYSPNYPYQYNPGTSCLYLLTVPQDYKIVANCSLSIPKGQNSCTTDIFFISRDADQSLNGAEKVCGSGYITRVSKLNKIVIAYSSSANSQGGRFICTINLRKKS